MTEVSKVVTQDFSMDYFKFGNGKRNLVIIPGLSIQSVMGQPILLQLNILKCKMILQYMSLTEGRIFHKAIP